MRTHKQIVEQVGAASLASFFGVSLSTTRSWARRDSIPAEFWQALVSAKHATLEELAVAAASRPRARFLEQVAA